MISRELIAIMVRHGETEWNAAARLQGQTDVPLSNEGRRQARLLGERFGRSWKSPGRYLPDAPNAVYSSDLSRAYETAAIVLESSGAAPSEGLKIYRLPELRERSFGKFEGLTAEESAARYPGETHHNAGETHQTVFDRMDMALADIWSQNARPVTENSGIALIVGHGGSLRTLLSRMTGGGPEGARHFHLDNTGISIVRILGDSWEVAECRIVTLNDTAHLQ